MIKLIALAESIGDQSRDPNLHSSSVLGGGFRLNGIERIFIAFSPEGIIAEWKKAKGE
jgi:hypothetical protein